jgi:predicted 2-oxoglutarate/Fe(II)-dependent dioxygenase YbiX
LDFLALAAEQGSQSAQRQLSVLGNGADNGRQELGTATIDWRAARASIDIDALLQPPPTASLSDQPRIRTIGGFATRAECEWLIGVAAERLQPATVFDEASGHEVQDPGRNNSSFTLRLSDLNVLTEVIRNRIAVATRLPVPIFEPSQIFHYAAGQRFSAHHDFLDPTRPGYSQELERSGQRIATFLIFLNDGYEGGETSFPAIDLKFRGAAGDALFFANVRPNGAPDPDTLHAGLPPTRGEKWIFSQWIRNRLPNG